MRITRCGSVRCWVREDDAASLISRQVEFWSRALAGLPDQLVSALRIVRGLRWQSNRREALVRCRRWVPEVHAGVEWMLVQRESNTTMFMVVHAALAVTLARLSGTSMTL